MHVRRAGGRTQLTCSPSHGSAGIAVPNFAPGALSAEKSSSCANGEKAVPTRSQFMIRYLRFSFEFIGPLPYGGGSGRVDLEIFLLVFGFC
jgi:hypothetical protein